MSHERKKHEKTIENGDADVSDIGGGVRRCASGKIIGNSKIGYGRFCTATPRGIGATMSVAAVPSKIV